ncbi:MAG: Ig-like domain-containing protein [Oscillospiraceae bacterium]
MAENLELTTFRNTSIGGTLSANAPDGSPLTFRITTEPVKGTVTLTDSGTFVYTPADGKRGRDYFGFRAADSSGRRVAGGDRAHRHQEAEAGHHLQ